MPSSDESSDPIPELISNREQMEYFWNLRQENILPLERAWNQGRFYGLLLKGCIPFKRFQRVGILLLGITTISIITTEIIIGLSTHPPHISFLEIPHLVIFGVAGLRFCWVALKPFRSRD
jgi:hypothetical protein